MLKKNKQKKPKTFLRYFRSTYFCIGIFMLAILLFLIIFAPLITPWNPYKIDVASRLAPPVWIEGGTSAHILGTDAIGRDLLTRILFALRTSFFISLISVTFAIIIGSTLGLCAGYFGGVVDTVISSLTEIQLSFPFIILAISILSLTKPTIPMIIIVLTLSCWSVYSKVVRTSVIEMKDIPYVYAAYSIGSGHFRIIKKYFAKSILPNVIVVGILDFATVVILEAILGFLGLGVRPPTASLGNIIADGKKYLSSAWWICTLPGGALFFSLLSLNLIGEGLRETLKIDRLA